MAKHNKRGKAMERILEQVRPEAKPNRAVCLMLFEDENCARHHWSKMSGGKLYTVAADQHSVLHRGDMKLVDQIGANVDGCEDLTNLARDYWNASPTKTPCIEVLVHEATVIELIGTELQRKEEFKNRFISHGHEPEPFDHEP
jgi:hypothetical protein